MPTTTTYNNIRGYSPTGMCLVFPTLPAYMSKVNRQVRDKGTTHIHVTPLHITSHLHLHTCKLSTKRANYIATKFNTHTENSGAFSRPTHTWEMTF